MIAREIEMVKWYSYKLVCIGSMQPFSQPLPKSVKPRPLFVGAEHRLKPTELPAVSTELRLVESCISID